MVCEPIAGTSAGAPANGISNGEDQQLDHHSGNRLQLLTNALGARRAKSPTTYLFNFAVPSLTSLATTSSDSTPTAAPDVSYAQIDVTVCSSLLHLIWGSFIHSYGDLSQILGAGLRPLDLCLMPSGFVLRIPCIQSANLTSTFANTPSKKTACELVLTQEPQEVMRFLGLNPTVYALGFATEESAFQWVSSNRYFNQKTFIRPQSSDPSSDGESGNSTPETNSKQRASDRHRKKTRSMYMRFVEGWLPAHPNVGAEVSDDLRNKLVVVNQAVDFFGKRSEYNERIATFEAADAEARLWEKIKARITGNKDSVNATIRGLRRWVSMDPNEKNPELAMQILTEPRMDAEKQPKWSSGCMIEEELLEWVDKHWEPCKKLERERVKGQAEARKAAK